MASCVSSRRDRFQVTHARCFEVMQICEVMPIIFVHVFQRIEGKLYCLLHKKKTKSFYFIEANSLCRLLKETSNTFSVFSFYRKRCVDRWCRELERNENFKHNLISIKLFMANRYMCWIWILKLANRFLCSTDDKAKEICQNMSQVETKTTDIVSRLRCITSPAMKNKLKLIRLKWVLIFA